MKAQKSGLTQEQWFQTCVLHPAREAWGDGWSRLSPDQKIAEVQAKAWVVLTSSGRIDHAATDEKEAAVLGRHVVYMNEAFHAWRRQFEAYQKKLAQLHAIADDDT